MIQIMENLIHCLFFFIKKCQFEPMKQELKSAAVKLEENISPPLASGQTIVPPK